MKARILRDRSGEKQAWFLLENGVSICIERHTVYGDFVLAMEQIKPKGIVKWHTHSGFVLPREFDFANDWREVVLESDGSTLIKPKFQIIL